MTKELHGWNRDKLRMKGRHKANFEAVIDALDVYSETQSEFDAWLEFVNNAIIEYKKLEENYVKVETEIIGDRNDLSSY